MLNEAPQPGFSLLPSKKVIELPHFDIGSQSSHGVASAPSLLDQALLQPTDRWHKKDELRAHDNAHRQSSQTSSFHNSLTLPQLELAVDLGVSLGKGEQTGEPWSALDNLSFGARRRGSLLRRPPPVVILPVRP